MSSQLEKTSCQLNRLNRLMSYANMYLKPYRRGRIKQLYDVALKKATLQFDLQRFDLDNYSEVLSFDENLNDVLNRKKLALDSFHYDLAAQLRDEERKIVRQLLSSIGVNTQNRFFIFKSKLFDRN
jgi:hypothetical protein